MNLVQNYYHLNPLGFKQVQIPENDLYATLPKGVYRIVVQETMQGINVYFAPAPMFSIPEHVIPDTRFIERVKNTYSLSDKQLGILLHGLSGMGKSMLAKQLCVEFIENYNMPVIVFDFKSAEYISSILEQLAQPCVILLDEFEKMFGEKTDDETSFVNQNELLSILDGTSTSKHLFLLTANKHELISPYMFNRPSRIRYCVEFDAIPKNIIENIIEKAVADKEKAKLVKLVASNLDRLTYDVLFELIKESTYSEDLDLNEILRVMNITFKTLNYKDYDIKVEIEKTELNKNVYEWLTNSFNLRLSSYFDIADIYSKMEILTEEEGNYIVYNLYGNASVSATKEGDDEVEEFEVNSVYVYPKDKNFDMNMFLNNKFSIGLELMSNTCSKLFYFFGKQNLTQAQVSAIQKLTFNVTFTRKQD